MGPLPLSRAWPSGEGWSALRFRATIPLGGKTATGIEVPPEVVEGLGAGKRPQLRVTINGHTYPSTLATRGGKFLIPVSSEQREQAGVSAGDDVDVHIEVDNQPREVTVPVDFAEALNRDDDAKRFWDGLSYSKKRWHVLSIEGAKTAETRQRRIDKSITMLREGRAR